MTLYGGLAFCLGLSPVVLSALGLRFADFWDAATFTLLAGMIVTRVGCLLNGCCCGRRSEGRLGVRLPDHMGRWERRYPVPLLEIAGSLLLAALSAILLALSAPPGTIFVVALAGYGCVRLVVDRLRETSHPGRSSHRLALTTFLAFCIAAYGVGWLVT